MEENQRQETTMLERSEKQARVVEEAKKRQEEDEKRHREELKRAVEREASLREQLESTWDLAGPIDPSPFRMVWTLAFSEQIDNGPIPSHFRELEIGLFDGF
ncbi:hypothetical protein CR513_03820, partial [Mucuna pruriens]